MCGHLTSTKAGAATRCTEPAHATSAGTETAGATGDGSGAFASEVAHPVAFVTRRAAHLLVFLAFCTEKKIATDQ